MTCDAADFVDHLCSICWVAFIVSDVDDDVFDGCGSDFLDYFAAFGWAWVELGNVGSVLFELGYEFGFCIGVELSVVVVDEARDFRCGAPVNWVEVWTVWVWACGPPC